MTTLAILKSQPAKPVVSSQSNKLAVVPKTKKDAAPRHKMSWKTAVAFALTIHIAIIAVITLMFMASGGGSSLPWFSTGPQFRQGDPITTPKAPDADQFEEPKNVGFFFKGNDQLIENPPNPEQSKPAEDKHKESPIGKTGVKSGANTGLPPLILNTNIGALQTLCNRQQIKIAIVARGKDRPFAQIVFKDGKILRADWEPLKGFSDVSMILKTGMFAAPLVQPDEEIAIVVSTPLARQIEVSQREAIKEHNTPEDQIESMTGTFVGVDSSAVRFKITNISLKGNLQ